MVLIQLCLALVMGTLYPLASAPMVRKRGGWYPWSGVLCAAWVASVSGILVERFPDWAFLYLFEARGFPALPLAVVGVVLSVGVAWLGTRWVLSPILKGGTRTAAFRGAVAVICGIVPVYFAHRRISQMATTFEYAHGLVRPLQEVMGFRGLATMVLIMAGVPSAGILFFLIVESTLASQRSARD